MYIIYHLCVCVCARAHAHVSISKEGRWISSWSNIPIKLNISQYITACGSAAMYMWDQEIHVHKPTTGNDLETHQGCNRLSIRGIWLYRSISFYILHWCTFYHYLPKCKCGCLLLISWLTSGWLRHVEEE